MIRMAAIYMLVFSLSFITERKGIRIELEEDPEQRYSYNPELSGDTYICYKDILILGNDVYHKENGSYIKTDETLCDMLGIEDYSWYRYRQYKNMIVTCCNEINGDRFLLYDMDTNKRFRYPEQETDIHGWYLYDGYLYYRIFPLNEIRKIPLLDLSDEQEQIIYNNKKEGMRIREFAMRSDGKILCEWLGDNKREYYLIELYDNGEWEEEKIAEIGGNRWKYVEWYAFNQYGLFQVAEFYRGSEPKDSMSLGEDVIIRGNGMVETFDIETKGRCNLYLDTGCLVSCIPYSEEMLDEDSTHLLTRCVSGVIFYDYAGNVQSTYQLIDSAILQEGHGYYMRKLMYHAGKIIAIYTQENTGKLYIIQVKAEVLQ